MFKQCDAEGRIVLGFAAVVERTPTGELRIAEGADNVGLVGTASGSLIGMLVGVLGGPVGVLVGRGAGALMGGVFDLDRAEKSDEALALSGRRCRRSPPPSSRRCRLPKARSDLAAMPGLRRCSWPGRRDSLRASVACRAR